MILLEKKQIRIAVEMSWPGFESFMLENFFPKIEHIAGREYSPQGFLLAIALAVEDVFSGHSPIIKGLVYLAMPTFFRNLKLKEEDTEKVLELFLKASNLSSN